MTKTFVKDPDARLDYRVSWQNWLMNGEVITAHTVVAAAGITVDSDTHDDTTVTAWLSGGTVGETYPVTFRATTNQTRVDDRTIRLMVRDR